MRRPSLRSERGLILVMALLISALALSLGLSITGAATAGSRMARQSADSTQAYYLAQAGLEDVANRVATGYLFPTGTSTYGPFNLGAGRYQVQVTYDGLSSYTLVSTGSVGSTSRTIRAAGSGHGFSAVIFVFGSNTTATWDSVDLNGSVVGGTVYPAQVIHNGSLNIQRGTLGGMVGSFQVPATLSAVKTLTLGPQKWSNPPNCGPSGWPWQSSNGKVVLYGSGTGCGTAVTYTPTNYAALMRQAQMGGPYGTYTTQCPFQGAGTRLVLSQPQNPNPYNNYVYFVDCSGYNGSGKNVEVGTDALGLAGSFTLVIYCAGHTNRITGLIIDDFIARPGANLGLISDVANQTVSGSTIDALLRFDATSGHASFTGDAVVNGAITAYDLDTGSGTVTFNVTPVLSGIPPGFTNFTFNSWTS